jgi:hypothetical protein
MRDSSPRRVAAVWRRTACPRISACSRTRPLSARSARRAWKPFVCQPTTRQVFTDDATEGRGRTRYPRYADWIATASCSCLDGCWAWLPVRRTTSAAAACLFCSSSAGSGAGSANEVWVRSFPGSHRLLFPLCATKSIPPRFVINRNNRC